jgi:hypothetical protein
MHTYAPPPTLEMRETQPPCADQPDAFYNEKLWPFVKDFYCKHCPLRVPCLEEALRFVAATADSYRWGMWSGTTPQERADMMKRGRR